MKSTQINMLVLGCGGIAQSTLPFIIHLIDIPASNITIIDFVDQGAGVSQTLEYAANPEFSLTLANKHLQKLLKKFYIKNQPTNDEKLLSKYCRTKILQCLLSLSALRQFIFQNKILKLSLNPN